MNTWYVLVILCCVLLFAFLSYLEWKRKKKARFLVRIVLSFGAVLSLLLMAIPVSWIPAKDEVRRDEAILLTDGFNQDSVNGFKANGNNRMPVYHADSLRLLDSHLTTLHVFGNGLAPEDYRYIPDKNLVFHPSPERTGFASVSWNQNLFRGERLQLEGLFTNYESSPVKLVLNGFNTVLDSISISAAGTSAFRLNTVPAHTGKAVYYAVVLAGEDTLFREPIPVMIKEAEPIKIFMLSGAPDFEMRFLKNWLTEKGFHVVTRTRISREKFEKGFYNTASFPVNKLTTALISRFDLIVADEAELHAIPAAELSLIRAAVEQTSLGLFIRADTAASRNRFYHPWFPRVAYRNSGSVIPMKFSTRDLRFTLTNDRQNAVIRQVAGTHPLITDSLGAVFLNSTLYGAGKITYSILPPTFPLRLSGDSQLYSSLWTEIINETVKTKRDDPGFFTSPPFTVPHQETILHMYADSREYPSIGDEFPAIQQDPAFPEKYLIRWWPRAQGWQPDLLWKERKNGWFVYDSSAWLTLKAARRKRFMLDYIQEKSKLKIPLQMMRNTSRQYLPESLLFLTFIFCCSILWIEKKFF